MIEIGQVYETLCKNFIYKITKVADNGDWNVEYEYNNLLYKARLSAIAIVQDRLITSFEILLLDL